MFGKFAEVRRRLTSGTIVTMTAGLAVGCSDPVASTDLRPAGDPEVLSVLVMNDSVFEFLETATFCKTNDEKRPAFVGTPLGGINVCDDDVSAPAEEVVDAIPTFWYTRIMFDELLDPNVEELIPILDPDTMAETGQFTGSLLNTQPVNLTCGGTAVAYDGYYSPSGNNVTWPVGPSLFIAPLDLTTVATSSECTVEIKDTVVDKDGNSVPADQRGSAGEYKFQIAPLEFLGTAPEEAAPGEEEIISPEAPVVATFNAFIDAASIDAATEVAIKEVPIDAGTGAPICDDAGTAVAAKVEADPADPTSVDISLATPAATCPTCVFDASKAYVVTFSDTNAVADLAGGPGALPGAADFSLCFTTDVAP